MTLLDFYKGVKQLLEAGGAEVGNLWHVPKRRVGPGVTYAPEEVWVFVKHRDAHDEEYAPGVFKGVINIRRETYVFRKSLIETLIPWERWELHEIKDADGAVPFGAKEYKINEEDIRLVDAYALGMQKGLEFKGLYRKS